MVIYKATCKNNGKVYIGKTKNTLKHRQYGHKHKAKNPGHCLFAKAIAKHGFDNFTWEIVETCKNLEELNRREQFYISQHNSTNHNFGYNITIGGEDTNTLSNHPQLDNIRKKISNSMTEHNSWFSKGKTYDQIHGESISKDIRHRQSVNNVMRTKNVFQCWVERYGMQEAKRRQKQYGKTLSLSLQKPKKHLTSLQKQTIIESYEKNMTVTKIAKQLKLTRYRIQTFLIAQGFTGPGLELGYEIKHLKNKLSVVC